MVLNKNELNALIEYYEASISHLNQRRDDFESSDACLKLDRDLYEIQMARYDGQIERDERRLEALKNAGHLN